VEDRPIPDSFWVALPGIIAAVGTVLVAILQMRMQSHVKAVAADVKVVAEDVKVVAVEVHKVEKATNSLTDRLVESTAKASHAEGVSDEKQRVVDEASGAKP
jgi:hypothetical protein